MPVILQGIDARVLQEYAQRIAQLRDVRVHLKGAGVVGLTIAEADGVHRVTFMDSAGLAFLSGQVSVGFVVMTVGGVPTQDLGMGRLLIWF